MKNYQFYVGIDVSKLTLDITLVNQNSQVLDYQKITNPKQAIALWVKSLSKQGFSLENLLVCFENTGVYSMLLSMVLSQKEIDFSEVPALEIQRSKGLKRGKSDKNDSKDIALYSLRNRDKLVLSKVASQHILELKMLFAEREKLTKALKSFKMTQENKDFVLEASFKFLDEVNQEIIRGLENSLERIEQRMLTIFKEDENLSQQRKLLKSIPGIGDMVAVYLIITTKGFSSFKTW